MTAPRGRPRKEGMHIGRPAGNGPEIEIVEVQDPYETDKTLKAAKNIRTHPLDHLYARGRLIGHMERGSEARDAAKARKDAGEQFLRLYEKAEIGGARAIDYSRVKVDTSFVHKGLSDSVMEANRHLAAVSQFIGQRQFNLMVSLIGERRTVFQIAGVYDGLAGTGSPSRQTVAHLYQTIREALDDLVDYFGVKRGGNLTVRSRGPKIRYVA